jgi:hypothetical protein
MRSFRIGSKCLLEGRRTADTDRVDAGDSNNYGGRKHSATHFGKSILPARMSW